MSTTLRTSTRVLDWRSQLLAWAESVKGQPFAWGQTDCATLARQSLAVCFGVDIFPNIVQWKTPHQGLRIIRQRGRPSQILEKLGAEKLPVTFARAGDIVVLPELAEPIGREALGVWLDGVVLLSGRELGVHTVARPILPEGTVVYSLWEIPDRG